MITEPIIIDNFLEEEYFNKLVDRICSKDSRAGIPWWYGSYDSPTFHDGKLYSMDEDPQEYLLSNTTYKNNIPNDAEMYNLLQPFCRAVDYKKEIKSLLRLRSNLFIRTNPLYEYEFHIDYPYPHTAGILSLNTCDGYTKMKDGTKVESIANRMLLFEGSEKHASTTTSNKPARFNLVINFL